jgi:hypothetical protein
MSCYSLMGVSNFPERLPHTPMNAIGDCNETLSSVPNLS